MTNTDTPAVVRERVSGCICTFIGEWDGHSGVVAHHSGPWPVWIDKSCPVHGAAAPAPDVRDQIAAILTRAMQDGQGDRDVIALATDDLVALLGGGR
jgi:hypothetical protein